MADMNDDEPYICDGCRAAHGLEVTNVSGSVKTVGSTTRHTERGALGRFVPRHGSAEVRPLSQPAGPGGIDAVTGQFIPGVQRNDVLFRDPGEFEAVHYVARDWSNNPAISTLLRGRHGQDYYSFRRAV